MNTHRTVLALMMLALISALFPPVPYGVQAQEFDETIYMPLTEQGASNSEGQVVPEMLNRQSINREAGDGSDSQVLHTGADSLHAEVADVDSMAPAALAAGSSGMPGRPNPPKPIPHHEPGHRSPAASYTTEARQVSAAGVEEIVQLSGLDAMTADGLDPLAGNYSLIDLDQMLYLDNTTLTSRSYMESELPVSSSPFDLATDIREQQRDVAAGDLNGDGQDEQIAAWIDRADNKVYLAAGLMPGAPGKATSAPAMVAYDDGSMDLVVRGYDDALWHRHYDGTSWGGWDNRVGGILASAPSIIADGTHRFDVFAVNTTNGISHRYFEHGNWSTQWVSVPVDGPAWPSFSSHSVGPMREVPAPVAVARGSGRLDLFRLGWDNTLRWAHSGDGGASWQWQNLHGMLASGPAAVSLDTNHMQVFARGVDEALWTLSYNNGWQKRSDNSYQWQRVELTGIPDDVTIASAPTAVSSGPGQIRVYVRGSDGKPYWIDFSGSWGIWQSGEGKLASGLGAAFLKGTYQLIARGPNGLLQYSGDGTSWTEWADGLPHCCLNRPLFVFQGDENDKLQVRAGYIRGNGRAQIVLAHQHGDRLNMSLYETDDSFNLQPIGGSFSLENSDTYKDKGWYKFSVTTGQYVKGAQEEVALASLEGTQDDWQYWVRIIEWDEQEPKGFGQSYEHNHGDYTVDWWATLDSTAGDFDADGVDELATILLGVHEKKSYWTLMYLHDFADGKHPGPDSARDTAFSKWIGEDNWTSLWWTGHGLRIAAGDVDGDGTDEIVRTWPKDQGWYTYNARLHRYAQIVNLIEGDNGLEVDKDQLTWVEGDALNHNWTGLNVTAVSAIDRLAVGDLDRDNVEEIVWIQGYNKWVAGDETKAVADLHVIDYVIDDGRSDYEVAATEFLGDASDKRVCNESTCYSDKPPHHRFHALATGSFTGESLMVRPPTYRVQNRVDSIAALINMPPKHRDLIRVQDGDGQQHIERIDVLTEECSSSPDPGCTHTKYGTTTGDKSSMSISTSRDWEIGAALDTKATAGGFSAELSLENSYGEGFSETTESIDSTTFSSIVLATDDDKIVAYGAPYAVWEYPVHTDAGDVPFDYITIVFPLITTSPSPQSYDGYSQCDEEWLSPRHQLYNVWSYDPIGNVRNVDHGPGATDILSLHRASASWFEVRESHFQGSQTEATQAHDFSASASVGYESKATIPFTSLSFGYEIKATVSGSYSQEELATDSLETEEETELSAYIGEMGDTANIDIYAIAYWSDAGYLVVDYQTEPGQGATWKKYNKPDPAFRLPWYGFPDPDNLKVPPCGVEKQLFSHDVVVDPPVVQAGETVSLTATVRNFSHVEPTTPVTIRFYLGDPSEGNQIGEEVIGSLRRVDGPQSVTVRWTASEAGAHKIYAVIDPDDELDEMHDEGDLIDNNSAFARLKIGAVDFVDTGTAAAAPYKPFSFQANDALHSAVYLPPGNLEAVTTIDFSSTDWSAQHVIGKPVVLDAYQDDSDSTRKENDNFKLKGETIQPPAVIAMTYSDSAVTDMNEEDLAVYRYSKGKWTHAEATCTGYRVQRFPEDNIIAVPICQIGTFALADETPQQNNAPTFTSQPVTAVTVGEAYRYVVTTTDPDVKDTCAISASTLPDWLTLSDNGDGTAMLSGSPVVAGVFRIKLSAQDGGGAQAFQEFLLIVTDKPRIYLPIVSR